MALDNISVTLDEEGYLNALLDAILVHHLRPEDPYEIAAILESMGWNDARAAARFGVNNVFELAQDLWERFQHRMRIAFGQGVQPTKNTVANITMELVHQFLRGAIFALPMAISVFSMLILHFSLWSYYNYSVSIATAIAIGTILSFVTIGGFTQAIARRGYYYIFQNYYNMAKRTTFYFVAIGFITSITLATLFYIFNWFTQMFTPDMIFVILIFYFVLNIIWVSVTIMYILKREILFSGLVVLGIGLVYLLFIYLHLGIMVSQLIAMVLVSLVSLILVIFLFNQAERREEKGINQRMPKFSITVYLVTPYFVYGFFYFLFLFVDRIISWSTPNTYMPYLIWFRTDYEVGLDFALLTLILPMGVSEAIIAQLMHSISNVQRSYLASQTEPMNGYYAGGYWKYIVIMAAVGIISALGVYYLVMVPLSELLHKLKEPTLMTPTTHFVFIWALVAYVLIAVALLNAVFLFTLSQPKLVLRSLYLAVAVNIVVGFLLTRWVSYTYGVFGLLAGAIVFTVLSTMEVLRVLRHLDYHLYELS